MMPIKEKFDDTDNREEDDIALSILAGYKEGLEKLEQEKAEKEDKDEEAE